MTTVHSRSCRRLQRRETDCFQYVWETYSDARFKKTFRVSRGTFRYILGKIEHDLTKDPISPALRLAICLYRLSRGDYYFTICRNGWEMIRSMTCIEPQISFLTIPAFLQFQRLNTSNKRNARINKQLYLVSAKQEPHMFVSSDSAILLLKMHPRAHSIGRKLRIVGKT